MKHSLRLCLCLALATNKTTMAEPDDLYTLRAQFWLGHYDMVRSFELARSNCWWLGLAECVERWYPTAANEPTQPLHAVRLGVLVPISAMCRFVWPHALGLWVEGDAVLQKEMDGQ